MRLDATLKVLTALICGSVLWGCVSPSPSPSPEPPQSNSLVESAPKLSVDSRVAATDVADLAQLLEASAAVLRSTALAANASRIASDYPQVFLNPTLGYEAPPAVVTRLQKPTDPVGFMPTPVYFGSGAITGYNNGIWRMTIAENTLRQWRSADPVERSCAVNTVAHEITHTLVDTSRSNAMLFIDGGTGGWASRRAGTTGSYVIGQLAQCTWLEEQGRIAADDVASCVPVFYTKPKWPWQRGKFAVGKCDDFSDGRPVAL